MVTQKTDVHYGNGGLIDWSEFPSKDSRGQREMDDPAVNATGRARTGSRCQDFYSSAFKLHVMLLI